VIGRCFQVKAWTLAAWLIASGGALAADRDASFPIKLHKPDGRALRIIKSELGDEISRMTPFPTGWSEILAAWVTASDSAEPLLFVKLDDEFHCGNVNCELFGLEKTHVGWRKVFQGTGEKWTVLASSRSGHRDILKVMHGGAEEQERSVYRWVGGRYRRVSTQESR
jgi:hypothetical protein